MTKFQLNAMKKRIESENPDKKSQPLLATELSAKMMNDISAGLLTKKKFPDLSEEEWSYMETKDPFKVLICSLLKRNETKSDPDMLLELEAFRKLADKIPAVITTNYDRFLEDHVFREFSVLLYPDDYYFGDSSGYGEILKIHGTVDKPETIVILAKDYMKLKNDSKLIMSRITTLLCQHPIVFLGYSLSDEEIHQLIYDIVTSLRQSDLDKIRGNLITVSVREENTKAIWKNKAVENDGRRIEVVELSLPNLRVLFNYLDKFTPTATPLEIKKYRDMIHEIVISADSKKRVFLMDANDLGMASRNDLAVIFGKSSTLGPLFKGIIGYEVTDAILDVLKGRKGRLESSQGAFLEWLKQKRISKGTKYIPLFYYFRKYKIDYKQLQPDIVEFIDNMKDSIEKHIAKMESKCSAVDSASDIDEFLNAQVKSFSKADALMYFLSKGIIDREECRKRLLDLYCEEFKQFRELTKIGTDIRRATTYLDMCNFS